MSEKGLSPRQQMINLMYLFLTAMLALNVSAEILNAFVLINKSIIEATDNVKTKNIDAYGEFEKAFKENPTKVGIYYDYAQQLKLKTNELDSLIKQDKYDLVVVADGPEGDVDHINKKDDNNVGGQVMILEGRGEALKDEIDAYRDFVLSLISDTTTVLAHNVKDILSTADIESANEPGTYLPWANANFEHLPLIAVIAMMSKMQNDIRNVESDMLTYLLGQIGKSDFKFNTIEAIVNAPNSYVKVGEDFTAEVFIAAYDSTKDPIIVLDNGTKLDVQNGKGVYNPGTGSPGTFTWGGEILLKDPATGDTARFPFEHQYQVVAPTWAISPTKMNVLYIGVDNPIQVTATGRDISATISGSGGRLTSNGGAGKYNAKVTSTGTATISVIADGNTAGSMQFRCLPVPDPYATVGGMKGGVISQQVLLSQRIVKAQLDNFVFDLAFPVTGFSVSATIQGFTEEQSTSGATITAQQQGIIRQLNRGQKVYFENIKARAPDGSIRSLGSISFKLQ
ncbi:MAG: gliding motility protein GldM [Bacteroidales bacterium]|nr:gliding motility protein GldM [Bacteroidales bacterium]